MKKALSILLALLLAVSLLPAAALADGPVVVVSNQNLRVNGRTVNCERYNIDGSNYFKLRDLAYVLNGTGSQFSVEWDGTNKCVSLFTGKEYEPNGSELDLSGGDKSATAAPSGDRLMIDGADRSDLSAYKIGGNNYFKLKDLGEALGFKVDYDTESRTMIVVSRAWSQPTPWRTQETFYSSNSEESNHSVSTYDADGRLLSSLYEAETYTEKFDYFYDELGYEVQNTYDYASEYDGSVWEEHSYTVTEYDKWGQAVRKVTTTTGSGYDEPDVTEESYLYDGDGNLITQEILSSYGHAIYSHTYNERGALLKSVVTYGDGDRSTTEYVRDEKDRVLSMSYTDAEGKVVYSYAYEYDGELLIRETYVSEDYSYVTAYTYDEAGNMINRHTDSTDWDNDTTCAYDAAGRLTESVYYDGADLFTSRYTYDEAGRTVRMDYTSPDYDYVEEYTYDAEGNCLTDIYTGTDYTVRTEYAYDRAAGKRTETIVLEYPAPAEIVISQEELTLAMGDEYYLYYYFSPYNSAREAVTWSSSDKMILTVDGEGRLKAVRAGTAVVTVTSESGLTASCTVTVASEKYWLTVEPDELELRVGECVSIRCSVESVGTSASYLLQWDNSADDTRGMPVLTLKWGDWLDNSTCLLSVTGNKPGKVAFKVSVISKDEETVYTTVTVIVTVVG